MIYLRIIFVLLFALELYQTKFKKKTDKWVWFLIVVVFGMYGYAIYLAYRRLLVVKRIFSPKFQHHYSKI